jgi:tRNA-Thr(GGU) m(6)t(6)A37 methyltransferase TsaA
MKKAFHIYPIGIIRKTKEKTWIEIDEAFTDGLLGIQDFSHVHVFYWFHENDSPEGRKKLRVHPRRNPENPLTGVFATHSPLRPNLIALSLCKIISVCDRIINLESIDARDRSPVIDIKCYIPYHIDRDTTLPVWVR